MPMQSNMNTFDLACGKDIATIHELAAGSIIYATVGASAVKTRITFCVNISAIFVSADCLYTSWD